MGMTGGYLEPKAAVDQSASTVGEAWSDLSKVSLRCPASQLFRDLVKSIKDKTELDGRRFGAYAFQASGCLKAKLQTCRRKSTLAVSRCISAKIKKS